MGNDIDDRRLAQDECISSLEELEKELLLAVKESAKLEKIKEFVDIYKKNMMTKSSPSNSSGTSGTSGSSKSAEKKEIESTHNET
jgi:hypothetical protein